MMRSLGWMALAALLVSGCAVNDLRRGARSDGPAEPSPREEITCPLAGPTNVADPGPAGYPAPLTTGPLAGQTTAKVDTQLPNGLPHVTVNVAVSGMPAPPLATAAVSQPGPIVSLPEPAAVLPSPAPPLPLPDLESPSTMQRPIEIARATRPVREKTGRVVATVGDQAITLPELTAEVKARLTQLGPDTSPTRRQIIAVARSTLKAMMITSLVEQEAQGKLGGLDQLEVAKGRIDARWNSDELPATLRREGVADELSLRSKLAGSLETPESLRSDFQVRTLAAELMRRDGLTRDFDAYLATLRRSRPIVSIMTPAELAVAGRKAAEAEAEAKAVRR